MRLYLPPLTTQYYGDRGETFAFRSQFLRDSQARLCRGGHYCRRPNHTGVHGKHQRGDPLPRWQDERGQGFVGVPLRDNQTAHRPNIWALPSKIEDSPGEAHSPNPRLFPHIWSFSKLWIISSGMKPEEMVSLTSSALRELIDQHQQLPGSVKRVSSSHNSQIILGNP